MNIDACLCNTIIGVNNVPAPYEISKLFPTLIRNVLNFSLWEKNGFLEDLKDKEKYELAFLLEESVNVFLNDNIDPKKEKDFSIIEIQIFIPIVIRLYRRHRINNFDLIYSEFKNISSLLSISEEEFKETYCGVSVEAELIALITENIAENLGFKYEENYQ